MSIKSDFRWLKYFLNEALAPFDSAACVSNTGEVLDVKYETLADIGTLSIAATTVTKYFPLKMGDVVLLNDPYSGGTVLSTLTLITPLLLDHKSIPNLYLAVRTGFRPKLGQTKSLEEEGLRIPPTPICTNREIQQQILEAIKLHPHCPENIEKRLIKTLNLIWKRVDSFSLLAKQNPHYFGSAALKNYMKSSNELLSNILSEIPYGDAKAEIKLPYGEVIRVKTTLHKEKVEFDFSGTSTSTKICMTDASTFGACFGALSAFLRQAIPINSGTFSMIHVTSPLGCLLNAKYPSPTFRGMTEGAALVAGLVLQTLYQIATHKQVAGSGFTPAIINLDFDSGKRFFDSVPGGTGATAHSDGTDAIHFWVRTRLQNSVQEIESRFPLLIHQITLRMNSGGKGKHRGGHGLTKEYELLAPAKLNWVLTGLKTQPQGLNGAKSGTHSELVIISKAGKKQVIDQEEGELHLPKGSKILLSSAGGGGFGKE